MRRKPLVEARLPVLAAIAGMLSIMIVLPALHAQTGPGSDTGGAEARLAQLSFIAGTWRGEHNGAVIEERWSVAEGDNMTGMFRLVKEGEGVFYEFMTIEQAGDTPVLRIRHFSQGLVAWEEKDRVEPYPLLELADTRAVFENKDSGTRLVYECPSPDRLEITLEKRKNGTPTAQIFRFHRSQAE